MGRIRVLSDQVANKIAAGEVVERPASVIKELLENSLDAGATHLKIEVESGGRKLIRVSDDGSGMLRDDALLAFERHATSKLSDVKDLVSISTLGFRGEALPSIASVARLVLETRSAEEATGMRVEFAGGKLLRAEEAALAPGTTITVRDLFYNVPARKKFLRSEQTELAHIASLVTHYSLAHAAKSVLLRSGSNELLHVAPTESLRDRVYQVFGSQMLEELVEIGWRERELKLPPPYVPPTQAVAAFSEAPEEEPTSTFRLRGFASRPQYQKLNRNSIFSVRQRPSDSGPAPVALHLLGVLQLDAAGMPPLRVAFLGVRLRRGRRQRTPFEDRGALPARVVRTRFREGRNPGGAHRVQACLVAAPTGAAGNRPGSTARRRPAILRVHGAAGEPVLAGRALDCNTASARGNFREPA